MAIELKDFFAFTHYEYGEAYFGSYKGMRYRLAREPLENVFFVKKGLREWIAWYFNYFVHINKPILRCYFIAIEDIAIHFENYTLYDGHR